MKILSTFLAIAASVGIASGAAIFTPGDTVFGGQLVGANFEVGVAGFDQLANNWPDGESPDHAIDGVGQKYLNFANLDSGIVGTPSAGSSVATSITLWTANDADPRDPASYSLYGTNVALGGGPFALADFTLIASGALALPLSRNGGGNTPLDPANSQTINFANNNAYSSYMIVFPTLRDDPNANSMQIAEIQLDGRIIPEPSAGLLALLGVAPLLLRRRRK